MWEPRCPSTRNWRGSSLTQPARTFARTCAKLSGSISPPMCGLCQIASGSVGAVICQGVCNYLPDPQAAVNGSIVFCARVGAPTSDFRRSLLTPGATPGSRAMCFDSRPAQPRSFAAWTKHETVPDGRLGGALLPTHRRARRPWLRPLRLSTASTPTSRRGSLRVRGQVIAQSRQVSVQNRTDGESRGDAIDW